MDMKDVAFAKLKPEQLEKIRNLEQELGAALDERVILLAYEERDKTDAEKSQ